jgi:hypothetical protein
MAVAIERFLKLRDQKDVPANREEMLELARYIFRSEYARIEQALAQRRPPSPQAVRDMEISAVEKILAVFSPK